jgi:hypothetical protein
MLSSSALYDFFSKYVNVLINGSNGVHDFE